MLFKCQIEELSSTYINNVLHMENLLYKLKGDIQLTVNCLRHLEAYTYKKQPEKTEYFQHLKELVIDQI